MDDQLRALVWERAGSNCEYCFFPATYSEIDFEVDHIIARKHRGETVAENLALACFYCNSYKGPNIASIDVDSNELTALFNPRTDSWFEHFRWDGPILRALTPIGRVTIHVLQMNHCDAIAVRESLMEEGVYPNQPHQ